MEERLNKLTTEHAIIGVFNWIKQCDFNDVIKRFFDKHINNLPLNVQTLMRYLDLPLEMSQYIFDIICKNNRVISGDVTSKIITLILSNGKHNCPYYFTDEDQRIKNIFGRKCFTFNVDVFYNIFIFNKCDDNSFKKIINFIFKKFKMIDVISNILDLIIQQCIENKCDLMCESKICEYILDNIPNIEVFEKICYLRNPELIKYAIDKKLIPTQTCFNNVVDSIVECKTSHKILYEINERLDEIFNTILSFFVQGGYVLTEQDIEYTIKNKIKINKIEKYGVALTKNMFLLCKEFKFFIYDFSNIVDSIEILYIMCLTNTQSDKIIAYIAKHKLIPDITCLENTCESGNTHLIQYFIDKYKIKVNKKCFKNLLQCKRNAELLNAFECMVNNMD